MVDKVREIFANYTDVSGMEVDSVLTADLGLSSFDLVSILNDFEDAFEIEIPDNDIRKFISVKDVLAYLEQHA